MTMNDRHDRKFVEYREPLPAGCPPDAAREIIEPRSFFRLVRDNPPTDDDFRSQRAEKPFHTFPGISECQARGLSVFARREDSSRALLLPSPRGRWICCVKLGPGAGSIQQTGRRSHHTWWPLAPFDILGRCTVEVP